MGLRAQTVLTPGMLASADRRLDELPAAAERACHLPAAGTGRAYVEAVVIERPRTPASWMALAVLAARAATDREVSAWSRI